MVTLAISEIAFAFFTYVQETTFIEQLVPDESVMEGRPPGCLKVMVWHLHLEAPKGFAYPAGWTLTTPLQANIPLRIDD
jgi:hypothetical protein